ncbi:MAG TPA: D-arabinono-1,4-lactone oxidase [Thermoanaerobaculia bacterium]|nr:D-arabinono-1,4-lactone oxidase [Thermoanaerobaculia bacterium]
MSEPSPARPERPGDSGVEGGVEGGGVEWSSWSGRIQCRAREIVRPASEEELIEVLRRAVPPVRVVGSGHSFTGLCATSGILISLDRMQGLVEVDPVRRRATVLAGTVLHRLGPLLREQGLAMENLGDIDRQSLAGAIATGTHGTGRELGNLSSQVTGMRLVTASGRVVDLGEDDPRLAAARVSLGALGIATRIELRLLEAYRLHERRSLHPAEEILPRFEQLAREHRHAEIFWTSKRDRCQLKLFDGADEPADLDRLDQRGREGERIGWSDRVLPSVRETRFHEIELAVAAERGMGLFLELRTLMRERYSEVRWPLELRTVAADDAWLSPAHGRATMTVSAHQGADLPYEAFFADVESIGHNHGARPHWGKVHGYAAGELAGLYPRFGDFRELRAQLDPEERLVNDHLRRVLLG